MGICVDKRKAVESLSGHLQATTGLDELAIFGDCCVEVIHDAGPDLDQIELQGTSENRIAAIVRSG